VHFLHIEDDLPHARWQLAMAWHPDHSSPQSQQSIEYFGRYLEENPQLIAVEAFHSRM
jgi:hypothetical protein